MLLLDLLFAGMETTITTLKWGFLYMIINADAQARVHEELDRECGDELTITMKHRSKLPYTLAAINVSFVGQFFIHHKKIKFRFV
jgi:cytochrome P450